MLLFTLLKYHTKHFLKKIYWLLLLSKAKKGAGFKPEFPIQVGGKGVLVFGNNCTVKKNAYFGCGINSEIKFGNNCIIDENVEIIAAPGAKITFGDHCHIMRGTVIRSGSEFIIGSKVQIASNCAIFSREGGHYGNLQIGNGTHIGDSTIMDIADDLTLGAEVAIGPNCVIYTHDHDYSKPDQAAWKGGVVKHPVIVEDGAWIGSSVTLLPKVIVGARCVVAAGAVVTKSTDANSIYGGIPAKKIKSITETR